jgi:hypothetical protein
MGIVLSDGLRAVQYGVLCQYLHTLTPRQNHARSDRTTSRHDALENCATARYLHDMLVSRSLAGSTKGKVVIWSVPVETGRRDGPLYLVSIITTKLPSVGDTRLVLVEKTFCQSRFQASRWLCCKIMKDPQSCRYECQAYAFTSPSRFPQRCGTHLMSTFLLQLGCPDGFKNKGLCDLEIYWVMSISLSSFTPLSILVTSCNLLVPPRRSAVMPTKNLFRRR